MKPPWWLLLFLLTTGPATAAPPVAPDPRPLRLGGYEDAARAARLPDWGAAEENAAAPHVFLRLGSDRIALTIGLPPSVPSARADRWFAGLSDAMGWSGVDLYSAPRPGGVFLRATLRREIQPRGPGRNQVRLDLGTLRARLREVTSGPVWLAVRAPGVEVTAVSPEPAARLRSGDAEFLFYRLDPASGSPALLAVEYGLPRRWLAAVAAALLLWMLFPLAGLFVAREHLRRQRGADPKERLRAYRRWQRGLLFATLLGMNGTFLLLGPLEVLYLLGGAGAALIPLAFLVPLSGYTLAGRLIGLPLEREAWPQRQGLPWYRAAAGELTGSVLMLLFPLLLFWISTRASGWG